MKTCPECNGDGVIEKGTDDEQQYPMCGGSGSVPDDDDDDDDDDDEKSNTHSQRVTQSDEIDAQYPLWIVSGHVTTPIRCPLCRSKQTFRGAMSCPLSAKRRLHALQQRVSLLDHVVYEQCTPHKILKSRRIQLRAKASCRNVCANSAMVFPMRKSRIKKESERAIIYRMVIGIVQRFDATYRQYGRRSMFSGRRSLGSSLETYLIGAAVLIGEAEGQLFTAYKLASFLGLARGTVQRKLDHLERVKAVERVGQKYRVGEASAQEAGHVDDLVRTVMIAAGALSKLDTKALAQARV